MAPPTAPIAAPDLFIYTVGIRDSGASTAFKRLVLGPWYLQLAICGSWIENIWLPESVGVICVRRKAVRLG